MSALPSATGNVSVTSEMRTIRSASTMQRLAKNWQRAGIRVGLVPTMGYLHAGHLSLVRRARGLVGKAGKVGASRPTHFRGVTTVVAKLLNIVQPSFAVFGAKDYQQAAIVTRMVRDLNFPLKIVVAPIFREADGLAMSSRNKYLHGDLRGQAVVLWRSIQKVQHAVRESRRALKATTLKSQLKEFIEREPAARLDYIEFFDPHTLAPRQKVSRGTQMALAVFIGKTRLIDNASL